MWRSKLAAWLRRLANALDTETATVVIAKDALYQRAQILSAEWDPVDVSGEHKRHQVYARLLKEFPTRRHRAVSLVIDVARG